jgi:uncharacterized membrane protein (DUF4010 family)
MFEPDLALRFAAALGLGLLLGLERERAKSPETAFAGVRTFALIALSGATAAYIEQMLQQPWLVLVAFGALTALVVTSYFGATARGDFGMTTEVTALLAFLVGALCVWDQVRMAAAISVAALLLLALKDWLHRLAQRIEMADVEATLKFAIITVIVLPLLPDRGYGPPSLEVINPYEIWLMVVLISGLNFVGYILVKVLGSEHGIGLTGILGGLVSSTAVTLGFAQRSRSEPGLSPALVLGILLAWTLMFFRVLVEVGVVSGLLAARLAPGLGILGAASLAVSFAMWQRQRASSTASVGSVSNPFELGNAVRFGLLFGVVTFVTRAAELYFGEAGVYAAAALAGLNDVDAIALSMANLAAAQPDRAAVAARAVVIAVVSNTVMKFGYAFWLGGPGLRRALYPVAAALGVAGVVAAVVAGRVAA